MQPRPIWVNGVQYPSSREAARYIVNQEEQLGFARKENTIAKELKRCWQGASWKMYGRYEVNG